MTPKPMYKPLPSDAIYVPNALQIWTRKHVGWSNSTTQRFNQWTNTSPRERPRHKSIVKEKSEKNPGSQGSINVQSLSQMLPNRYLCVSTSDELSDTAIPCSHNGGHGWRLITKTAILAFFNHENKASTLKCPFINTIIPTSTTVVFLTHTNCLLLLEQCGGCTGHSIYIC